MKHYREPQYGVVTVRYTNMGMDKEASCLIKLGRKVLELKSRHSTAYMGHYRHTEEAILWNGPALRSGVTMWRKEVLTHLGTKEEVSSQEEGNPGYSPDISTYDALWTEVRKAAIFSPEESRRSPEVL